MDTPCYTLEGGSRRNGYVRIMVGTGRPGGEHKWWSAHRIAWMAANGPIPDGLHVLHHCDNRACIRADHLYVGTNDDNVRDKVMRMRQPRKISHEEADEIRRLYAPRGEGGISGKDLAKRYGVSVSEISRLVNGRP